MFKDIKHVWNENLKREIKENDTIFQVGLGPEKLLYTEPKRVQVRDKRIRNNYEKWIEYESDSNAETDEIKKWVQFKDSTDAVTTSKGMDSWVVLVENNGEF